MLAATTAVAVFGIMELARLAKRLVDSHLIVLTVAAGLAVGGLAIAFAEATGGSPNAVLFSGESAFGELFASAANVSLSTLALLVLFKGLAWSISLGTFRGGPTFPAIFLGAAAGIMAGLTTAEVQKLLRHRNISTTAKYVHLADRARLQDRAVAHLFTETVPFVEAPRLFARRSVS